MNRRGYELLRAGKQTAQTAGVTGMLGVKCASTANIASLTGTPTLDGVATAAGMLILVWKQSDTTANGIYSIPTDGGAWTKEYAFDSSVNAITGANVGMVTAVAGGTLYGKSFILWNGSSSFVQMGGYYF